MIKLRKCENYGTERAQCNEKCSIDGKTCLLSINLDKCTCNGIHIKLQETAKYDFVGVSIAYFLTYIVHFSLLNIYFWRLFRKLLNH